MVRRTDRAGYLVVTHVLICALDHSPRLSLEHRVILSGCRRIFVGAVVIWEIAAKSAKGKLHLTDDIDALLLAAGCMELPVTWEHAKRLRTLPQIHRDPFDRMLVAQAAVEHMVVLTGDSFIRRYPIEVI